MDDDDPQEAAWHQYYQQSAYWHQQGLPWGVADKLVRAGITSVDSLSLSIRTIS